MLLSDHKTIVPNQARLDLMYSGIHLLLVFYQVQPPLTREKLGNIYLTVIYELKTLVVVCMEKNLVEVPDVKKQLKQMTLFNYRI